MNEDHRLSPECRFNWTEGRGLLTFVLTAGRIIGGAIYVALAFSVMARSKSMTWPRGRRRRRICSACRGGVGECAGPAGLFPHVERGKDVLNGARDSGKKSSSRRPDMNTEPADAATSAVAGWPSFRAHIGPSKLDAGLGGAPSRWELHRIERVDF
jgi:hypothetical protein